MALPQLAGQTVLDYFQPVWCIHFGYLGGLLPVGHRQIARCGLSGSGAGPTQISNQDAPMLGFGKQSGCRGPHLPVWRFQKSDQIPARLCIPLSMP
jgi:hypothetical protein